MTVRLSGGLNNRLRQQVAETKRMLAIGLPYFETLSDCAERNNAMVGRFIRHGAPSHLIRILNEMRRYSGCEEETTDQGVDGDWLASRRYRLRLLPQAVKLLSKQEGPVFFVTIALPKWKIEVGQLRSANVKAIKKWLRRRLAGIPNLIAIGSYEVSLGVDRGGNCVWEGHLHLVTAGARKALLKNALPIRSPGSQRGPKPLKIDAAKNISVRLAYSTKRLGQRRVAYLGRNGRQQRIKLPLSLSQQLEFDAWLLAAPAGFRTILMGCRIHRGKLLATKNENTT